MVVVGAGLVAVAAALLVAGLLTGGLGLVYGAIIASGLALGALAIAGWRHRSRSLSDRVASTSGAADEPTGSAS